MVLLFVHKFVSFGNTEFPTNHVPEHESCCGIMIRNADTGNLPTLVPLRLIHRRFSHSEDRAS